METGLSSESVKGGTGKRHGAKPAKVEPFVPRSEHNPKELRSWAKRTGFVSDYSGEAGTSASEKFDSVGFDQKGGGSSPKIEIDPVLGRARPNSDNEIEPVSGSMHEATRSENDRVLRSKDESQRRRNGEEPGLALGANGEKKVGFRGNGNANSNGHGISAVAPVLEQKKEEDHVAEGDIKVNLYPEGEEPADGGWQGPSGLKCGLTENPGFGIWRLFTSMKS